MYSELDVWSIVKTHPEEDNHSYLYNVSSVKPDINIYSIIFISQEGKEDESTFCHRYTVQSLIMNMIHSLGGDETAYKLSFRPRIDIISATLILQRHAETNRLTDVLISDHYTTQ